MPEPESQARQEVDRQLESALEQMRLIAEDLGEPLEESAS
jgi:hypothetical protein